MQATKTKRNNAKKATAADEIVTLAMRGQYREIAFSALFLGAMNVRKTLRSDDAERVERLAAKIEAVGGLIQNLAVVAEVVDGVETGRFEVVAGGRRYRGLEHMHTVGRLNDDSLIPCRVYSEADALLVSAMENDDRESLHPADEFEAFKSMAESGRPVEDIAAAFGVSPAVVQRRLLLANVAPSLIEVFRSGGTTLETLMAFAVCADHGRQVEVWERLASFDRSRPDVVRRNLTQGKLPVRSGIVRFVGLPSYLKAGGTVTQDLFDTQAEAGYVDDAALVERLANEKLTECADSLQAEGWSWVEVSTVFTSSDSYRFGRVNPSRRKPTKEEREKLQNLESEYERVNNELNELVSESDESDEENPERDSKIQALEALDEQLSDSIDRVNEALNVFSAKQKATAGCVVSFDALGALATYVGLVRRENSSAAKAADREAAKGGGDQGDTSNAAPKLSDSLTKRLTAERTAILQTTLAANPNVALVALAHALVLDTLYERYIKVESVLAVRGSGSQQRAQHAAPEVKQGRAWQAWEVQCDSWKARLPEDPKSLFGWLLQQDQGTVLDLLALCTAHYVDTIEERPKGNELKGCEIAQALQLSTADWWQPTAESYFSHVPKARIVEAGKGLVDEATLSAWSAMKKGDLVVAAEDALRDSRWVPDVMRYAV